MTRRFLILILTLVSIKLFGQDTSLLKFSPPTIDTNIFIGELDDLLKLEEGKTNNSFQLSLTGCCEPIMPEFSGGKKGFYEFLQKNLSYPDSSNKLGIEGIVITIFAVDTLGDVTDIKIEKGVNAEIDKEVLRVFSIMPKWTPGYCPHNKEKKYTKIAMTLPIHFELK